MAVDKAAGIMAGSGSPAGLQTPRSRRQAWLALYLLLASLGVFFAGSLLAYGVIRLSGGPPRQAIELPPGLWISTLLLLAGGWALSHALKAVRRERQAAVRQWLSAGCVLLAGFVAVQATCLDELLAVHREAAPQTSLAGLMFLLILLHALHVVGGAVPLGLVTYAAHRGRYDHESHTPLALCLTYWRFLEVVWLVMLATFWLLP
jgi:cytochrome c oxidase subunit 3